jgi:hypothetical protein
MGAALARALPRVRRPPAAIAVGLVLTLALAAGAALVATRDAAHRSAPLARGYDGVLAGAPLQRARCSNWQAASSAARLQAVQALSATIGGASTGGGVGTTLPDAQVRGLFDRVCSTPQTANFVLYLIYARAAAFSRHGPTPITSRPGAASAK